MAINPIELSEKIRTTYTRYLRSAFRLKNPAFASSFEESVESFGFTKGPILEATPSLAAGAMLSTLAEEGVLEDLLFRLCLKAFPYLKNKPLYYHQEQAIRFADAGRNIVIASGTGTGKTEAFLIPILNDIFRRHREGELSSGVHALILYPMNALANDQIRRMRALSRHLDSLNSQVPLTFGRYIGETEELAGPARDKFNRNHPNETPAPGELLSREQMRENPPSILITNYAMLEYLLLRPKDSPLFRHGPGLWRFVVLDEAHTYGGSKGNEIAMLLRRLKAAVGAHTPGELRCVATSATILKDEEGAGGVARFVSNLFGEPFDRDGIVLAKQTALTSAREEGSVERSAEFYSRLKKAVDEAQTSEALHSRIAALLDEAKEELPEFPNDSTTAQMLYAVLERDANVRRLQEILAEDPRELNAVAEQLLGEAGATPSGKQAFADMVELAARAKPNEDSAGLLPARYHMFVRAPEGAFLRFGPTPKVLLDRHEMHEEFAVFEIGTCRRCGQEYLVGTHREGMLRPVDDLSETGATPIYYLPLPGSGGPVENEDELVAMPEGGAEGQTQYKLCQRCGRLSRPDQSKGCDCGARHEEHQLVLEIEPRSESLNQCFACGLRSTGIVRQFLFQKDAPSAVLATALFTNLNAPADERRILAFSDSRQDAAYFAPYLERTYERILYRRLITKAVHDNTSTDYGLQSLFEDVYREASRLELFSSDLDERQRQREVWRWIIQDYTGLWDRRNSLEGVGLLSFAPVFPERWQPPAVLSNAPWNLTPEESAALYRVLLDSVRYNMVITFPGEAPARSDQFFAPRNREYYIRGKQAEPRRGIYAWMADSSRHNARTQFLQKLAGNGAQVSRSDIDAALAAVWEELTTNWIERGMSRAEPKGRTGVCFRLDYKYWRVSGVDASQLLRCNNCGSVLSSGVRGVCPTYNCNGTLKPIEAEEFGKLRENHYRVLYEQLQPARAAIKEHTAQLTPEYAAQLQSDFVSGRVNILSCSTTFELGVDLGQLESVFLKNVPPEPANYVQRVGRAGRRAGSVGYALTFVQRRSHDLNHYRNPERLVSGRLQPPSTPLHNTKIARRHLHSIALARYFKDHPEYYGKLHDFIRFGEETWQSDLLNEYLERRPPEIASTIKRVMPPEVIDEFDPENWGWVDELVGNRPGGVLRLAEAKVRDEYDKLVELIEQLKQDYIQASNQRERDHCNAKIRWAESRSKTLHNMGLIDFLSSNTVLPKYGFPVDVVDLAIMSNEGAASNLRLQRDLRIAVSEFAPSSPVIANGYVWKSTGLRAVPERAWERYRYAVCDACGAFSLAQVVEEFPDTCRECGAAIPPRRRAQFVVPIFGFVSGVDAQPERAGLFRPSGAFGSRPYFFGYTEPTETTTSVNGFAVTCRYSKSGRLAVVSRGPKGAGYKICEHCGHAEVIGSRNQNAGGHRNPYGTDCSGVLRGPFHLGHTFHTDVVELALDLSDLNLRNGSARTRWYSLLYAVLEGLSETLDIQRQDISGCLHPSAGSYSLILFDEVPGGAGHVAQIADEQTLASSFQAAHHLLAACSCGAETSCYSCLRNYRNQFVHHHLERGVALEVLDAIFKATSK